MAYTTSPGQTLRDQQCLIAGICACDHNRSCTLGEVQQKFGGLRFPDMVWFLPAHDEIAGDPAAVGEVECKSAFQPLLQRADIAMQRIEDRTGDLFAHIKIRPR